MGIVYTKKTKPTQSGYASSFYDGARVFLAEFLYYILYAVIDCIQKAYKHCLRDTTGHRQDKYKHNKVCNVDFFHGCLNQTGT